MLTFNLWGQNGAGRFRGLHSGSSCIPTLLQKYRALAFFICALYGSDCNTFSFSTFLSLAHVLFVLSWCLGNEWKRCLSSTKLKKAVSVTSADNHFANEKSLYWTWSFFPWRRSLFSCLKKREGQGMFCFVFTNFSLNDLPDEKYL